MELATGLMQLWVYSQEAVLVVCAASATVIDLNPAVQTLAGRSREMLIGRPLIDLLATNDHLHARMGFQNALSGPATISGLRLVRGDGQQVAVSLASSDVFESDGRAHVLVFVRRER
jgi:PAS domain S-box-containing protein